MAPSVSIVLLPLCQRMNNAIVRMTIWTMAVSGRGTDTVAVGCGILGPFQSGNLAWPLNSPVNDAFIHAEIDERRSFLSHPLFGQTLVNTLVTLFCSTNFNLDFPLAFRLSVIYEVCFHLLLVT